MAPGYRANGQPRRTNRAYVDHDVFEGLPVRHWRRDYVTVAPPPAQESTTSQNDIWAIELPHGMPKDSHLLPQHSQDLLRAARSGRIYKRPAPIEEEEPDPEAVSGEKAEKKDDDPKEKGFTARAWKQVPRHLEGPDVEYLAKRRKGVVTAGTQGGTSGGPTLMKTTVRRTDAAGKIFVQDVVVPRGQLVEGDVIAQISFPGPNATGTMAEGLAIQPTPPRRKPPPPKRKPKGPGRGRKKKLVPPTSVPQTMQVDGTVHISGGVSQTVGADGIKMAIENGSTPTNNDDTEMADDSNLASDDEEGEDGEEGDEEDDEGSADNQNSPSKSEQNFSSALNIASVIRDTPNIDSSDVTVDVTEPDIAFGTSLERVEVERNVESPIQNIALTTSTLTSPLESRPTAAIQASEPAPPEVITSAEAIVTPVVVEAVEEMIEEIPISASELETLPPPPPGPTETHEIAVEQLRQEEDEEEEMLLDIVENANNANIGAIEPPEAQFPTTATAPTPAHEINGAITMLDPHGVSENVADGGDSNVDVKTVVNAEETEHLEEPQKGPGDEVQEEDDFLDLLGNLERELNKTDGGSVTAAPVSGVEHLGTVDEGAREPVGTANPILLVDEGVGSHAAVERGDDEADKVEEKETLA